MFHIYMKLLFSAMKYVRRETCPVPPPPPPRVHTHMHACNSSCRGWAVDRHRVPCNYLTVTLPRESHTLLHNRAVMLNYKTSLPGGTVSRHCFRAWWLRREQRVSYPAHHVPLQALRENRPLEDEWFPNLPPLATPWGIFKDSNFCTPPQTYWIQISRVWTQASASFLESRWWSWLNLWAPGHCLRWLQKDLNINIKTFMKEAKQRCAHPGRNPLSEVAVKGLNQ